MAYGCSGQTVLGEAETEEYGYSGTALELRAVVKVARDLPRYLDRWRPVLARRR